MVGEAEEVELLMLFNAPGPHRQNGSVLALTDDREPKRDCPRQLKVVLVVDSYRPVACRRRSYPVARRAGFRKVRFFMRR